MPALDAVPFLLPDGSNDIAGRTPDIERRWPAFEDRVTTSSITKTPALSGGALKERPWHRH